MNNNRGQRFTSILAHALTEIFRTTDIILENTVRVSKIPKYRKKVIMTLMKLITAKAEKI